MRTKIPLAIAAALAAAPLASPLAAQEEHSAAHAAGAVRTEGLPDGWMMRFDRASAGADMASFTTMAPGWHVTTGRAGAAIFWRPDMRATGEYRLDATMHLMKPAEHAEAFGVFLGGQDLEVDGQRYLYFLVRQTGEFLIKRRSGEETENVVGWTAHDAIPAASADGSTRYDLSVVVGAASVDFMVNGATVHSIPAGQVSTDGVAGARINHMLDVHLATLELTER